MIIDFVHTAHRVEGIYRAFGQIIYCPNLFLTNNRNDGHCYRVRPKRASKGHLKIKV